jgi:hypothetical protein
MLGPRLVIKPFSLTIDVVGVEPGGVLARGFSFIAR